MVLSSLNLQKIYIVLSKETSYKHKTGGLILMVKKKKQHDCKGWMNASYLILRISLGIFFFLSGLPKVQALIGGTNPLAGFGIAVWLAWIVAIVELVGGAFLVFGFLSMESGALISITMFVAIILLLAGGKMDLGTLGGWKSLSQHLLYIGGAMLIGLHTKGYCSIDKLWRK